VSTTTVVPSEDNTTARVTLLPWPCSSSSHIKIVKPNEMSAEISET